MNESKISVRYSKALLQIGIEQDKLNDIYQDMGLLLQICSQVDEFVEILNNPVILQSQKKQIINAVFHDQFCDLSLSLLEMIINNKREMYIPDIARRFISDFKKHKGITTVVLTTVIPLDANLKERIAQLIRDTYNTIVEIEEKQEEQLIGGFVLRVDDKMMDASVLRELNKMKKALVTEEFKRK